MPTNKASSVPPPTIGKIGRYTVFITPPSTPTPPKDQVPSDTPTKHNTTPNNNNTSAKSSFVVPPSPAPSIIQSPPVQFDKPTSNAAVVFFWDSVTKVQNAHSSLDDHLARWFGLNQSKYQWALDDYYESKEVEKDAVKSKETSSKVQTV